MKLVGIRYKETEFEGKRYAKYECHFTDERKLPGLEGIRVQQIDIRPAMLDENFEFVVGNEYEVERDEKGKVIAVWEE